MNQSLSELLGQGLVITVIGLGLVFLALALLWGLIALLGRVFRSAEPESADAIPDKAEVAPVPTPALDVEAQTAERARIAAIVGGALMANALPLLMEAPIGPTFEHGRTAPIWVMTNRAYALHPWQPPRVVEPQPRINGD